jgi:hypothetical protein
MGIITHSAGDSALLVQSTRGPATPIRPARSATAFIVERGMKGVW